MLTVDTITNCIGFHTLQIKRIEVRYHTSKFSTEGTHLSQGEIVYMVVVETKMFIPPGSNCIEKCNNDAKTCTAICKRKKSVQFH